MLSKARLTTAAIVAATCFAAGCAHAEIVPEKMPDYDQVKAELWARETASSGEPVAKNVARGGPGRSPYYKLVPSVWATHPDVSPVPKGKLGQVDLTFANMAYNGQTAVMMFKSHRTREADGKPVDQYFENTHVWSKEDGRWMLLASRSQPVQPPGL